MMREWEAFVPEEERKIYEKAGYKGKDKFGVNPALIIIDVITGFTGTKPMPVMDAIDEEGAAFVWRSRPASSRPPASRMKNGNQRNPAKGRKS